MEASLLAYNEKKPKSDTHFYYVTTHFSNLIDILLYT